MTTEPDQPVEEAKVINKPEFLNKKAPALGIILGGGGALAFSQLGVLQEFENQKIPIRAIAGLEWGSLMAATFAVNGKSHAAEWKLLKLPVQNFSQKSFFSNSSSGAKISNFDSFLNDLFANRSVTDLSPFFSCASLQIKSGQEVIHQKGSVKNVIQSCWPFPPHFYMESTSAHPLGIAALAENLKKQGAEVIVYIDVLSENLTLSEVAENKKDNLQLIWSQIKATAPKAGEQGVDEVIQISLPQHNIQSYQSLRALIRLGQIKSKEPVLRLAKKYDY